MGSTVAKLPIGANVRVNAGQRAPRISSNISWDQLQPPSNLDKDKQFWKMAVKCQKMSETQRDSVLFEQYCLNKLSVI